MHKAQIAVDLFIVTCVCYSTDTRKVCAKQEIAELIYTEVQVALVQGMLQVHSSKRAGIDALKAVHCKVH